MSTPADELKAAAEKLRGLATAVSAPDDRDQLFHADGADITQGRTPGMYDVATAQTPELACFIAAMHPGVGTALADWLESWTGIDLREDTAFPVDAQHAIAVARAINGPQ